MSSARLFAPMLVLVLAIGHTVPALAGGDTRVCRYED